MYKAKVGLMMSCACSMPSSIVCSFLYLVVCAALSPVYKLKLSKKMVMVEQGAGCKE